ncbi:MAG: DNA methyltransferase [Planctomycetota bacterium]
MPLGWNEIRQRAIAFAKEWEGETRERAEAKSFWDGFFNVFGLARRTVASFEEPVKGISGKYGFIDLFWRGKLLVEHKSRGGDLGKAESQAFRYIQDLVGEGRQEDVPRYVILSDFARIVLYDLEPEDQQSLPLFGSFRVATYEILLSELHKHVHAFAFIPGYKQHKFADQDPANIEAAEIMGRLHDALEGGGYKGHALERFLVRVLFCLFAEHTGIFEPDAFGLYIRNHTAADGSDLGLHLARLFDVLNTPEERRQQNLDEDLAALPYVNGELFAENLGFADFNSDMRNALLACTRFDWSGISPAIFGSLFQSVMEPRERRQMGAHYTGERDILKVIRPLFLDDLRAEFEKVKKNKASLRRFHQKLAKLRFLDPACGCGNFLVISYRELRLLEIEVLKALNGSGQQELPLSLVDVDAFYGIEILEWPTRIAEVAMWLMDHQMNLRFSETFGEPYVRLPLRKSPKIVQGNALDKDWKDILAPKQCSYVLGNPPFVGKHYQTRFQKSDLAKVLSNFRNTGDVDYVVGWFKRAAEYIQHTRIKAGFVATNSITQGEQVPLLWGEILDRYHLTIHFAHRTFCWASEARGKAHVHVVIIGFAAFPDGAKRLYDYEADPEKPTESVVSFISPYLTPGPSVLVTKRQKPLCDVPEMRCGNKPSDGGHLILDDVQRRQLRARYPAAKHLIRRFVGSEELINGIPRWCLWLADVPSAEYRDLPEITRRIQAVREFRTKSTAAPTKKAAQWPSRFFYISQPKSRFIAIPEVSSERRYYIPISLLPPTTIASNKIYIVPSPSMYLFGVLTSAMHMAWVKVVGGRLKSDFQYSGSMVYNTFPWPEAPSPRQKAAVEKAAQAVLDTRAEFPTDTLADLYDPLATPPKLVRAHAELNRAVDRCYRPQPFPNERLRVEYLFALYEKLTAPLIAAPKKTRPRRAAK